MVQGSEPNMKQLYWGSLHGVMTGRKEWKWLSNHLCFSSLPQWRKTSTKTQMSLLALRLILFFPQNSTKAFQKHPTVSGPEQLPTGMCWKCLRGFVPGSSSAGLDGESDNTQVKMWQWRIPKLCGVSLLNMLQFAGDSRWVSLQAAFFWFKASVWCLFPRNGKGSWEGIKGAWLTNASAKQFSESHLLPLGAYKSESPSALQDETGCRLLLECS